MDNNPWTKEPLELKAIEHNDSFALTPFMQGIAICVAMLLTAMFIGLAV